MIKTLAAQTGLAPQTVRNILKLLSDGATIPFIARYRKEMTGGADDEQLRSFEEAYRYAQKLQTRKAEIMRLIEERATLDTRLKDEIEKAQTLSVLEDLYRPFKEKKNSRAATALNNGLEPLANLLTEAKLSKEAFIAKAKNFVKNSIKSVDEAIGGAQDIIAERYSEEAKEREIMRTQARRNALIETKAAKGFDENGHYKQFAAHSEKIAFIPSHRYLAIMRGAAEKQLSVKITMENERTLENIRRYKLPRHGGSSAELLFDAYSDGLKRLLWPSIEREMHSELKTRSDLQAIALFGKNLSQLLMSPPVTKKVLLGVDPAFKSGCKLAVIDENGTYLAHDVIYPTAPKNDYEGSKHTVEALLKRYEILGAAIGNGTASQETQAFFARLNNEGVKIKYTVVSEAGASVYSASKIAQQEYPQLDVTIRGAISIAQRLRDPMAALVKIDPKSLGIGQYQHDVDQKLLATKLHEIIESLVNRVGVDVNSASASLLAFVAGVGPKLAQSIVEHREANGAFRRKADLLKVKGLGAKAYEQCAGFMRIREGESLLDNTGVHPESYQAAKQLLALGEIAKPGGDLSGMAKELGVGLQTLEDIVKELQKPGFDPREELPEIPFKEGMTDIAQLKEGSIVSGIVRNIADFGAFVDIGLKNDGMIHISQLSQRRIAHPLEVLAINQYLPRIEVIKIDREKQKIGLSLKNL